jgi:beta-glucuronidase
MLAPQNTVSRLTLNCDGLWDIKIDRENNGEAHGWQTGFSPDAEIAVPGSWNEQLAESGLMNYVGAVWYQNRVFVPTAFAGKRIVLRIGSADFAAKVWVNGQFIGSHAFGFLPFEFDVTAHVRAGETAHIVVWVSNQLTDETVPQGVTARNYIVENRVRDETFPPARFDFFPYGGIHRSVVMYSTPQEFISNVTVQTKILGATSGSIHVKIDAKTNDGTTVRFRLDDDRDNDVNDEKYRQSKNSLVKEAIVENGAAECDIAVNPCQLWSCEHPFLYALTIELIRNGDVIDVYRLLVGIREIKVEGDKLLLNGEPVFLKGFGKHEDFPVLGKATSLPLLVKDFGLLKWINANSFRTSHYPYAEEVLDFADRKGILIIDEVADISRDFRYTSPKSLDNHKAYLRELVERDKNHPCVIAWSISNEPNYLGEPEYHDGRGDAYWKDLSTLARSLDGTRPITIPNLQRATINDPAFKYCDFISINRYYGWYENPGQLDVAAKRLSEELDAIYEKYHKPILLSEFGADTVAGLHSTTDQLFTEEYQVNFLETYCKVIASKSYTIGEHVWNFADFRTPQHHRRVVVNLKGVFTRTREPKRAAFFLKAHWAKSPVLTGVNGASKVVAGVIESGFPPLRE